MYGASNPTIITASFEPKLIVFTAKMTGIPILAHHPPYIIPPLPLEAIAKNNHYYDINIATLNGGTDAILLRRSVDGKTISWYSYSATKQLNDAGYTYYCTLIG